MRVRITSEARDDLADGSTWYANRDPSTIGRFRDRFRELTRQLVKYPHSGQSIGTTQYRRLPLTPFPYIVIYEVDPDFVTLHGAKSIQSWLEKGH